MNHLDWPNVQGKFQVKHLYFIVDSQIGMFAILFRASSVLYSLAGEIIPEYCRPYLVVLIKQC